jgi:lipoprotein NlpD
VADGVQTAPIRSGAIESRGIDGRPLAPPGPAPGAPIGTAPGAPIGTAPGAAVGTAPGAPPGAAPEAAATVPPGTRTQPLGTKVPYSEAAVAETRAADAAAPRPAEAPQATAPAPAPVPPIAAAPIAPPAAGAPVVPSMGDGGSGGWMWPAPGRMIQTFEQSANRGIALDGQLGEPVLAASDGRVIFSGNGPRGYGNLVIVKHDNDLLSVYAHNRVLSVKEGQTVRRGQKIAEIGDSGTTSARLHFEIRQQGRPVDPMKFLPRR